MLRPPQFRPAPALGRARRRLIALTALLCFLSAGMRAASAAETQPTLEPDLAALGTDALPAGLELNPTDPGSPPTMASRWWFWSAVGAVAVASAVVIVASSRGSAPPGTALGNRVFAP